LIRRFNPTHADFDPLTALGVVDCGNVKLTPGRILDAFARIEQATGRIVETGAVPVTIGGHGSVTVAGMRAVARGHAGLVAVPTAPHTDAYAYDPADKYNAATQFTHVAEEGLLDASRSWHVGIRGTTFAHGVVVRTRELGYRIISLDELVRGGF